MTPSSHKLAWLGFAIALVVQGCECRGRGGPQASRGEIGVVFELESVSQTSREAVYDFGAVFMGQTQTMKMVVKNLGGGTLGLGTLEKESGDAVALGESFSEPNPVFDVKFATVDLGASEVAEFDMSFIAPQHPTEKIVEHQVRVILRGINTREGEETAVITLKAKAVSGVCELPKTIDFGSVARGDTARYTVDLRNPAAIPATAFVGDIYGGDALAFGFTPDSARGSVNLEPGTTKQTTYEFKPTEIKSYLAFVKMRASAQCPEYAVTLKGDGVDSVLTWSPNPVDFGYVSPGAEVTQEVTFTNAGKAEVSLSALKTLSPNEFKIVPEAGADPSKLTVPASGQAKLRLAFKPTALGPRSTVLQAATTLAKQPQVQVQLRGFGGGPDIRVTPSPTLNFGKVAYFQGAVPPSFQTRKLTVMNVGTKPAIPDPKANLKLGTGGAKPYWTITSLNADSALSEIEIAEPATTGPNSYDPAVGLEATAGKNILDLIVKVIPNGASPAGVKKEWEVTIFSTDPDQPETKVVVSADAVILPPCRYSVTPTALNFGLVTPPQYRDLAFTIKNDGQNPGDICLLSNLDMAAGSDPIFSLPAGPVAAQEMQPGETLTVTVRAWPQGQVPQGINTVTGQVQFFMSSDIQPQKLVSLQAAIAASCLTVAPNDLDFGTVQKGCNSATKTFTIYNTCVSPVTVNSFALQAAAGQPAGGPDCPGTSPCPEFSLVSTPATPLTISPGGAPVTFTARYRPIDFGADSGAIALNAVQGGQNVAYVVTLQGTGDTVGLNTDVFTQDAKPKADILLTIDDSCSMSDEQQALAANFSSFIKFAVSASVDYQMGVITTDPGTNAGILKTGANHPEKYLKPTTPDVENKFKAKVNVGTNGGATEMCFEPSLKALTAPIITNQNAGFLRHDAALAIVCVSDENEQSPQPVSYYFNQLLNIKGVKRTNMLTVNAIAGFFTSPPSGCQAYADDGRYSALVTQTNGVKESICTPDWSKSLEQLGKTAFGFRTNFFLNAIPDLTNGKTITVKIDGVVMPNVDSRGSTVWTYDPVANSVNFEPMFVPEPGQTLTITYNVTCY